VSTGTDDEPRRDYGPAGCAGRSAAFLFVALLLGLLYAGGTDDTTGPALHPVPAATVPVPTPVLQATPAEDDPDWDCTIHGNGVCGVPGGR
jgi:hypothetical protein